MNPLSITKFALLTSAIFTSVASAQTTGEHLKAMRVEQDRIKAEENVKNNQMRAEQQLRQKLAQERERERQLHSFALEQKRIEANQAVERERLALIRKQQTQAARDRARAQAYEDEVRRLDLQERRADVTMRRARADRSNDFIDRELSREDAKSNVINSNADANRNLSEGGREMLKGVGKGAEKHGLGK